MVTRIDDFTDAVGFRDHMTTGWLRRFEHTYRFAPLDDDRTCTMSDELIMEAPFMFLGRIVERAYLSSRMSHLVGLRLAAIKHAAEGDEWRRYLPV